MPVAFPMINGVRHSWSSVEIRLDNGIVLGITEINYSPKLEPGIVRGAGALPIAFTLGNAEYDGDFTILLEEFNSLMTQLGPGAMTVSFDIVVSYDATLGNVTEGGLSVIVDTLKGCRITSIEHGASSGSTDAIVRKCTVKPMSMLLNGVSPMPDQPTAAA
jgi:hypothetical protein